MGLILSELIKKVVEIPKILSEMSVEDEKFTQNALSIYLVSSAWFGFVRFSVSRSGEIGNTTTKIFKNAFGLWLCHFLGLFLAQHPPRRVRGGGCPRPCAAAVRQGERGRGEALKASGQEVEVGIERLLLLLSGNDATKRAD
jgi:hypothetical protein